MKTRITRLMFTWAALATLAYSAGCTIQAVDPDSTLTGDLVRELITFALL